MQQKVLTVGYSRSQFEEAQREWGKYGIAAHREEDITDAVLELSGHKDYSWSSCPAAGGIPLPCWRWSGGWWRPRS